MTDRQIIIDGEHDMNYCEDNNCEHYGNKEQCETTHCYYRHYSKLYTKLKLKEQECKDKSWEIGNLGYKIKNQRKEINKLQQQLDQLKAEVELLQQYKKSKQASYESMQIEWNKAVSQNKDLLRQNEEWQKQVVELKVENEELKEWQQTVKDMFNRTCRCKYNDEVSAMCKLTNKKCISINECMYRKHKTLAEIKEIIESEMDSKEFMAIQCMLNGSVDNKNKVLEQILQKISEVIPNET